MKAFVRSALIALFAGLSLGTAQAAGDPFAGIPPAVVDLHRAIHGAECDFTPDSLWEPSFTADLGQGWKIAFVNCIQGAYQASYAVYQFQEQTGIATPMLFTTWDSQVGIKATALVGEPSFNTKTHVLGTSLKGRGIGDCGNSERFQIVFNPEDGLAVKTLELRAKLHCDGKRNEWPKMFPAK